MTSSRLRYTAFIAAIAAATCARSLHAQSATPAEGLTHVVTFLGTEDEAPIAGVFIHENMAYVGGHSTGYFVADNIGVRIVDLHDPVNPRLIGRIPIRKWDISRAYSVGNAFVADLDADLFKGTIAVVTNGVPDTFTLSQYREPHGVWDVSDPANPVFLSVFGEGKANHVGHSDLGYDYPRMGTVLVGDYCYYLYKAVNHGRNLAKIDVRMGIVDLSDPYNPVQVGNWQDSSDVAMIGLSANASGTRLYASAIWPKPFGPSATHTRLYVIDISNPEAPEKLGQYEIPVRDRGNITSAYIARATDDDKVVVFADGSWGDTTDDTHGILHVLDVSDPANIVKVSEFDANKENPRGGWYTAVNVSIRGSTAYSAWMNGGVVAFDISDPANPKMTGQYIASLITDAVPLGEHYLVAGPAWEAGLHILRDESASRSQPTVAETDGTMPRGFALHQNYPNPFRASEGGTRISFELPEATSVRLGVFDVTGRELAVLVDETLSAGRQTVRFTANGLPGGVYLYRLRTESFEATRRAVVLK